MRNLWSEIMLAQAARATAEEHSAGGKAQSLEAQPASAVRRPLRRVGNRQIPGLAL